MTASQAPMKTNPRTTMDVARQADQNRREASHPPPKRRHISLFKDYNVAQDSDKDLGPENHPNASKIRYVYILQITSCSSSSSFAWTCHSVEVYEHFRTDPLIMYLFEFFISFIVSVIMLILRLRRRGHAKDAHRKLCNGGAELSNYQVV